MLRFLSIPPAKHRGRAVAAAAVAALVAACGGGKPDPVATPGAGGSPVLVRVGDSEITAADVAEEIALRNSAKRPVPEKSELLDEMVERAMLVERAKHSGLDQDPEIRRRYQSLLIGSLRERELAEKLGSLTVTEEEIRAEYERGIDGYRVPAKVRLAWLHLGTDPKLSPERRAEVRSRLEEARAKHLGTPAPGGRGPAARGFGALAIDYSDDQATRYKGGELGWLELGKDGYRWPDAVIQAGYALAEDGAVSDVIELPDAFCLVMRSGFVDATTTPLEAASASIRTKILAAKRQDVEAAFDDETRSIIKVERFPGAIADISVKPTLSPDPSGGPTPPPVPGN